MRERTNEVEVERDVKVTVSDGTVLLADLYHPVGIDDAPTILERTPYGRVNFASAMGPEFAARGYRYACFPGPMSVEFPSYDEAVELAGIFYPGAADQVRRRGQRRVPFEVLGVNPPRDLAFKVLDQ